MPKEPKVLCWCREQFLHVQVWRSRLAVPPFCSHSPSSQTKLMLPPSKLPPLIASLTSEGVHAQVQILHTVARVDCRGARRGETNSAAGQLLARACAPSRQGKHLRCRAAMRLWRWYMLRMSVLCCAWCREAQHGAASARVLCKRTDDGRSGGHVSSGVPVRLAVLGHRLRPAEHHNAVDLCITHSRWVAHER